jgi:hypothetical protein
MQSELQASTSHDKDEAGRMWELDCAFQASRQCCCAVTLSLN